jgi:hypothetical protein
VLSFLYNPTTKLKLVQSHLCPQVRGRSCRHWRRWRRRWWRRRSGWWRGSRGDHWNLPIARLLDIQGLQKSLRRSSLWRFNCKHYWILLQSMRCSNCTNNLQLRKIIQFRQISMLLYKINTLFEHWRAPTQARVASLLEEQSIDCGEVCRLEESF